MVPHQQCGGLSLPSPCRVAQLIACKEYNYLKKIMKLLEHFQDKIGMLKKELYSTSEGQLKQVFWMTYLSLQRNYSI